VHRRVGIAIVRGVYAVKHELRVANVLLATTSSFTKGVQSYQASRYDLALRDFHGIVDWLTRYRAGDLGSAI
jgi:hypothetical protein